MAGSQLWNLPQALSQPPMCYAGVQRPGCRGGWMRCNSHITRSREKLGQCDLHSTFFPARMWEVIWELIDWIFTLDHSDQGKFVKKPSKGQWDGSVGRECSLYKSDYLQLIPRTQAKAKCRTASWKLSSKFHTCTRACMVPFPTCMSCAYHTIPCLLWWYDDEYKYF